MSVGILLAQFLMVISFMLLYNWHCNCSRQKVLEEVKHDTLLKMSLLHGGGVFISRNYCTAIYGSSHGQETNVSGELLCPKLRKTTLMEEGKVSKSYVFSQSMSSSALLWDIT